jgi:signal transduction histidine kinase/CheY-like chemotaxis protein
MSTHANADVRGSLYSMMLHVRSPKPVTIRAHLLLLVLSVLLPALLAGIWIVDRTYRSEQTMIERNLQDTSRALSMVVDAELSTRAAVLQVLADSYLLDAGAAISAADLARFEEQARRAVDTGGEGGLQLIDGAHVLLDTRLPAGSASPLPRATGVGSAARQHVEATLLPLQASPDGAGLSASIIQPVRRNGETLLELKFVILPSELQAIIDKQDLPPDAVATILDTTGTVVARHPGGASYAGRAATPDLMKLMRTRREGRFDSVSLDGNRMLGYFSTSSRGWTYLTATPRSEFSQSVPQAVRNVALGALALLALAVGAAAWVARRIVRPIVGLKATAARMQAGQPVERRATGIAECDDVSAAMADASTSMREARRELERQVAVAIAQTRDAEQRTSQNRRVEALGRLTGGVAHDFNNVLGIISNSAHLMQRQTDSPALAAPLAAMLRAVEVGSRQIQYLLRFAGRQKVAPRVVDLARYLVEVREMMGIVLGKRIEISLDIAKDLPCVKVDTSELELALINLALNARDAMSIGGKVGIQARLAAAEETRSLPPRRYVVIAFGDTGAGIASDVIDQVFEPFFTTKEAGKGTGLGLSQVRGFCSQAGGTAIVSSALGMGTTVLLVLPAADAPVGPPEPTAPAPDARGMEGRKVLLVEDNTELGEVTAALLESFGFEVRRASGAEQAMEVLAQEGPVDVVLSDVLMPGAMDGLTMARALRESHPGLPVVLISGYSGALTEARDFVVLRKPCAPHELLDALSRAIDARP